MVSTTNPDSELFCSVSSTQKVPERHPSTLIPGGHTSPLRHPTVLRPGAGNHHARKSSSEAPHTPAQHHQRPSSTTPKPAYKAYSPPATPQDPRASVVADEIEGFFTALDIQPLHIKKQDTISSPSAESSGRTSPIQRCASPPLPPKVKLEEPVQLSPPAEVTPSPQPEEQVHDTESDDSEQPPAYEESERVQPPPEKPAATQGQAEAEEAHESTSNTSLAGSAAVSAARVGGSVAGVDTEQAAAKDTTEEAEPDEQISNEEATPTAQEQTQGTEDASSPADATSPPPLPPRPTPASASTTPQPDTAAQMPGAFPPPPRRSPSPKGHHSSSSSAAKMTYVPGAAATSATAVGAAVAIPSTDFAHGGLAHARKALGQRVSHLIDKAKEHHEARRGSATRGTVAEGEGKERSVLVVAPIA